MKHLTDEQMMEQVYGESEDRAAVEQHLARCRACADGFAELQRDLAALDRIEAPSREARYGERVWAAIAPLLPAYGNEKRRWWMSGLVKGLSYAAVCSLLVSSAFYAGRKWERNNQPPVAHVQAPPSHPKQPIVVVVLDDHLDRSERFLVELKHADLDPSAMATPMGEEARSLLAANRVCRKNAAETDDPELNTALDHLDHLLAIAANQPGGLNAQTISRLQDEMNRNGVLFEVRVLRSRISHRPETKNDPAKGGTV
ncbi:MAG TPA: hypothetical protein VI320_18695 [Terracidiphilus sp.]|jgi:hypothetical protein